jgi:hypothetical protein
MILPTKGITPNRALISVGAMVLQLLSEPKTVSRVWDEFRKAGTPVSGITFDWFVLSLDLLFALGAIDLERGRIHRTTSMEGRET